MMTLQGVTAWVPTTASATPAELLAALKAIHGARRAQTASPEGAEILGAHIEGRYISPHERGAHRLDLLAKPDPAEYEHLYRVRRRHLRVDAGARVARRARPHRRLPHSGIVVAAGHSIAVDEEFGAVDAGLSHATHIFGNMGTLRHASTYGAWPGWSSRSCWTTG